jgi:hypothetical protein
MQPLVTKSDLSDYKYVADSVKNIAVWPQYVSEAQLFDVRPWLGDALLNEIVTQANTSPDSLTALNDKLLDGGTYVFEDTTFMFQGLKAAIIYYAFARFTSKSSYNYTQAGITVKDSDLSTPASDKAIQRLQTENYLMAEAIKDDILLYLRRNSSDYPLFNCYNKRSRRPGTFYAVGD